MSADPIVVCERKLDNVRQELAGLKRARSPNDSMAEALVRGLERQLAKLQRGRQPGRPHGD